MIALRFHWHRFLEWLHQLRARRHFARGRAHHELALAHRVEADRLRPPSHVDPAREWEPRLWDRDHDPRSDERNRWP